MCRAVPERLQPPAARQRLVFGGGTELRWDGARSLLLEISMENDQANLLSTALRALDVKVILTPPWTFH
jgi:hypothetical protein